MGRFTHRAAVVLAVILVAGQAWSADPPEYDVKAAFLYNFLMFCEGNSGSSGPAILLVVGKDPFGKAFQAVDGRPVGPQRRPLEIRNVRSWSPSVDLHNVRLVFLAGSEKERFSEVVRALKGRAILTVADSSGFLEAGGMINLITMDRKVRWEVNRSAVREAGLRLSVQVLRNALRIIGDP